jgi:acetoin utilization deacetylase AcuC-like enzyme
MRIYHPDTPPLPLPPGHRFPAEKYHRLLATVVAEGILPPDRLAPSPLADAATLAVAHDPAYVTAAFAGEVSAAVTARIGLPWSAVLLARSRATVGGTLAAARRALADGVSGQLAGGTHHAHRDGGAGFCVFNDCAVAILTLLASGEIARAAVLDLDVHQGDGNAAILAADPRVHVASVHGARNYPFVKPASTLDIGLPDGADDAAYLAACGLALDAVLGFRPDVLFYIAGVDPLACDRLGRLAATHAGLATREDRVLRACRRAGVPVVVLIGGGYGEPISATVAAYAETWRRVRAVYG